MPVATYSTEKKIHDLRLKFGCSQEIMGHIIGVSGRTVARWEGAENTPSLLARQKVKEMEVVLEKMEGIVKKGKEKEWLNTPTEALGGKTPLETIEQGPSGAQEVLHLLGRLEWGIAT